MTRRLAAILAADVVGYSSLMNEDEVGTLAALKAHRKDTFDPEIERRGGRVVKLIGDGALVEFPSVVEAVECALAIQKSLATSGGPIRLRIGINLGDVLADGDDIYGEGVNIASRLEGLAEPGGICISSIVRESLGNRIADGFTEGGTHRIKGLPQPIPIWHWPGNGVARAVGDPPSLPERPSIAVLPFVNMSADPEQEYFSDGITEDIITALSRFDSLFVIARNSSFAYKGQSVDVKKAAGELGVHFILEGSVRKSGQRVRVSAQLIDGQDGRHLWAERYDGALEDVFYLQEQVTSQVVGSIAPQIAAADIVRTRRGERVFDEAYELAWQAQKLYRSGLQQRDPAMWARAIDLACDAVAKNPKCGLAYLIISEIYSMESLWRWGDDPSAAADLAEDWARRYFEQLPASYLAYYAIGQALWRKGENQDALRYLRQANELNSNDSMVLNTLAVVEASAGDTAAAKEHALSAIRLNPKDPFNHPAYLALAMAAFVDGGAGFEEWVSRAIQLSPNAPIRRAMMIAHAAEAGNQVQIETHLKELQRISPDFIGSLFRGENQVFQKPAHRAKLLEGLRKAGLEE